MEAITELGVVIGGKHRRGMKLIVSSSARSSKMLA